MQDRIHELLQENNYPVCIDFIRKNYNTLLSIDKNDLYNLFKHIYLLEDDARIIVIIQYLNLGTYDLFPYEELSKCFSEARIYTIALDIINKYICLPTDRLNTKDMERAKALKENFEMRIKEGNDCGDGVNIRDEEDIEIWGLRFLVSGHIEKVIGDDEYKFKVDEFSEPSEAEINLSMESNCDVEDMKTDYNRLRLESFDVNMQEVNLSEIMEKDSEETSGKEQEEEIREMKEESSIENKDEVFKEREEINSEEFENKAPEIKNNDQNSHEINTDQKRQKLTKTEDFKKKEQILKIQKELTNEPLKIYSSETKSLILSKNYTQNLKLFRCEKLKEKNSKIKFANEKCIKTIKGNTIYLKSSKKAYKLSKLTLENYLFVNSNIEKFVKFSIINFKDKYFYVSKSTKPLKIVVEENLTANLKIFKNFLGIAKFLVKKQFLIADRLVDSLLFHEKKGLVLNCFNLDFSNGYKLYREIMEIIYLLSKNCKIPNIKTLNFENNKKYKTFMRHEILNLIKIYTQKIKERIIFD